MLLFSGLDKNDPDNIYQTADMAIQMADDADFPSPGLARGYGILRGEVGPNIFSLAATLNMTYTQWWASTINKYNL